MNSHVTLATEKKNWNVQIRHRILNKWMWSYPLEKWLIRENQLAEKKIHRDKTKAIEISAEIFKT